MRKTNVKKLALLGLCASVALVLSYLEALVPPIVPAVPGIKLGLPNIVVIFVLYRFGLKEAASVSIVRVVIVSLLFGNAFALAYSIAGACLSLAVMALLKKADILSTVGVSVAGGISHNVGQILVAMAVLRTAELGYYLIILAISGTVAGIFVGVCGSLAIKKLKKK